MSCGSVFFFFVVVSNFHSLNSRTHADTTRPTKFSKFFVIVRRFQWVKKDVSFCTIFPSLFCVLIFVFNFIYFPVVESGIYFSHLSSTFYTQHTQKKKIRCDVSRARNVYVSIVCTVTSHWQQYRFVSLFWWLLRFLRLPQCFVLRYSIRCSSIYVDQNLCSSNVWCCLLLVLSVESVRHETVGKTTKCENGQSELVSVNSNAASRKKGKCMRALRALPVGNVRILRYRIECVFQLH